MTTLTYEEAQERSRLLDVHGYRVELDLTGGADTFGSVTVIRFGCRAPGSASFAELRPARCAGWCSTARKWIRPR
jgi:aminopeptidase N